MKSFSWLEVSVPVFVISFWFWYDSLWASVVNPTPPAFFCAGGVYVFDIRSHTLSLKLCSNPNARKRIGRAIVDFTLELKMKKEKGQSNLDEFNCLHFTLFDLEGKVGRGDKRKQKGRVSRVVGFACEI